MKFQKLVFVGASALFVGSCGGGDGGAKPTPTPTPPPTATLNVTLSESRANVVVAEGERAQFGFTANYTGTSSSPVVADVDIGGRRYVLDGTPTASGKQFAVDLSTVPFAAGGQTSSEVTFRLCTSSACSTVYPGSTQTFTVDLDVQLNDWAMFQRNPAHDGYVAVRYDPSNFAEAWQWDMPTGSSIQEPSATRGTVYLSYAYPGVESFVYALSSGNGAELWRKSLGDQRYISGPTFADGLLHVTSMETSSRDNPQWVLSADDGEIVRRMSFASQWHDFGQPTVYEGDTLIAAGYFGNEVYSFDWSSGVLNWQSSGSGAVVSDGESVAADENYVYYYTGPTMDVFDRRTGARLLEMADNAYNWRGYSWEGAPILDGAGNVFGFSSPHRFEWDSKLAGYSTATGRQTWVTSQSYTAAPAFGHGVLFAARADQPIIDAIDPASGLVTYSITMPGSAPTESNLVVTENLIFAANGTSVYAFDLKAAGRPMVWEANATGFLAITPDNELLVADEKKMRAFRLF